MQKRLFFRLLVVALLVLLAGAIPAAAATITFNDLATPNPAGGGAAAWGVIPSSYAGFTWSGWEVVDGESFNSTYGAAIFSGPFPNNGAYNGGNGNLVVTTSGDAFNFEGAYFSFWPGVGGAASDTVTITGYNNGTPVGLPFVVQLSVGFTFAQVNLNCIDQVRFTSSAEGRYWTMDNFQESPAPEPLTSLLLGSALVGIGALRRHKRNPR